MVVYSKSLSISKSSEEVINSIKSFASYTSKKSFYENGFSMHCIFRYNANMIHQSIIRGTVEPIGNKTEVTIELHSDVFCYLGWGLCAFGVLNLLICLARSSCGWIPSVGMIVMGLGLWGHSIWIGRVIIERLERELLK